MVPGKCPYLLKIDEENSRIGFHVVKILLYTSYDRRPDNKLLENEVQIMSECFPQEWLDWIQTNKNRGCDTQEMVSILLKNGIPKNWIPNGFDSSGT